MVYLFVDVYNFLHFVHPYGYIIFGIGSQIPIFSFEFFCWSKKTKEIYIRLGYDPQRFQRTQRCPQRQKK